MKRVLVTGASGFIGRHCLPLLSQRGFEVYALSSRHNPISSSDVHWFQFDLLGGGSIKELLASVQPTHLLHLAWNVTPGKFWASQDNLDWLKSSIDLLEAFALQKGKRAVLAGSCAEYDWTSSEFIETKTPCIPTTLYGTCKLALYSHLVSLAKQMGFSQAWGRIFYLYGPHENPQRFIPTVIKGLLQKKPVPCSHGNQIRDFLHVEDVAGAFVALLDTDMQGAVNIGSGIGVSLQQVIGKITDRIGCKELVQFGALSAPQNDPEQLVPNTERLMEELQWRPTYSLEEGLDQAIAWWKSQLSG